MKPSDFTKVHPWSSVLQNTECETTAACIMDFLAKTGDTFRTITFKEYKEVQPHANQERFEKVIKYCKNEDTAKLFSKSWEKLE